jgi:hypothetical protein
MTTSYGLQRSLLAIGFLSLTVWVSGCGGSSGSTPGVPAPSALSYPVAIAYESPNYSFTVGLPSRVITPKISNGSITAWSASPALPQGLSLSATNGSISGTPTTAAAPATYVVTGVGPGGLSTVNLKLAVVAAPLLDLGHGDPITFLRFANSTVLSQDGSGHWVLWNYSTAQNLANGNCPQVYNGIAGRYENLPVDLAGTTAVIQTAMGLELRAASDGHVLVEIAATLSWWKLASDGSYVSGGNTSGLTVWSTAGTVLFTRKGDYSNAVAFAAPAEVEVALGAAGQNVIETLSVPAGQSSISPAYQGVFHSWFTDGGRFLTTLSNTVWVYSTSAVQQDLALLPTLASLTGMGNWYWTSAPPGLTLYAVGSGGTATGTYPGAAPAMPSGMTVAFTTSTPEQMTVLNLSGASPTQVSYNLPTNDVSTYAARSNTSWVVGAGDILLDVLSLPGQPRYFDYGAVLSLSGSTTNALIATDVGRVLNFNPATNALQGTINQMSTHTELSSSGSVLAAAVSDQAHCCGGSADQTITIYSLPSGSISTSFPFSSTGTPSLVNMTLSGSGAVLGETLSSASPCVAQAIAIPGGNTHWCDSSSASSNVGQLQLSPDGTLVAEAPPSPNHSVFIMGNVVTTIYRNGTLATAIPGWVVGWIDNNTLLVNNYAWGGMALEDEYTGAALYDSTGKMLSSVPGLPHLYFFQALSSTSIYSAENNAIYSLVTGTATWKSGTSDGAGCRAGGNCGAVAGSEVVFAIGHLVIAEPY